MTTKNTRRDFTDKFKREAVSLLRGSGRPLTQMAAELSLQPSVLRRWRGPADEARSGATVKPANCRCPSFGGSAGDPPPA